MTAPGLYSWGFNDETCPPMSMYSAYNVMTAPKRLVLAYDTGHRKTQEQMDDVHEWLADQLTGRGGSVGGEIQRVSATAARQEHSTGGTGDQEVFAFLKRRLLTYRSFL